LNKTLSAWGDFHFTIKYYAPGHFGDNTKFITRSIYVPSQPLTNPFVTLSNVDILIAGPVTDNVSPVFSALPLNIFVDDFTTTIPGSSDPILTPQVFTGSYLLKAGDYSPVNLASTISGLLSNNFAPRPAREGESVRSQFLKIGEEIISTYPDDLNVSGEPLSRTNIFLRGDGLIMNQYVVHDDFAVVNPVPPGKNYMFGAKQIALEWDSDLLRFKWTYIHQPFYDSKGNEAVKYIKTSLEYGVAPGVLMHL